MPIEDEARNLEMKIQDLRLDAELALKELREAQQAMTLETREALAYLQRVLDRLEKRVTDIEARLSEIAPEARGR